MAQKPLKLGAAYHGNRMPHHAEADLRDMMRHGMDLVVHMFSHTDLDRHKTKMKQILDISGEIGLEVWVDNWGLGGPPGDKSHVLAYYPDAHIVYADGERDPVRACLNNPNFRKFTREWIDAVEWIGGKTIFWDEPHLPIKKVDGKEFFSCACPHCKALFEARFSRPMPQTADADVHAFRIETIADYFREATAYSAQKGMQNTVCVMLGESLGISLSSVEAICSLPTLHNIGSDPYWLYAPGCVPYQFVYENARKNIEISEKYHKDHNIWIQAYSTPRGREEEIVQATEAAYDAGVRTIIAWGYFGSASNDYAAENPELAWVKTCEAMARVRNMERDAELQKNRALYRK